MRNHGAKLNGEVIVDRLVHVVWSILKQELTLALANTRLSLSLSQCRHPEMTGRATVMFRHKVLNPVCRLLY
jgi:hypothetical protein